MRILITGASGLVGSCFLRTLGIDLDVVGTYHTRPQPGLVPLAIDNREDVLARIRQGRFTHIINCAGQRSPDACLADPAEAYHVNALAVEYLAEGANDAGACLCHLSTDYVFSGTKPPYHESDTPDPINLYGRTKLAGEHATRRARKHLIVRIPAQWRTDLADPRNFATVLAGALFRGEILTFDSGIVRYYTLADDVARAVRFLLEQGITGLVHVSAEQKTSKFDFARRLARALGCAESLVQEGPVLTTGDVRPVDSHIATARYAALGGPSFTDIDTALARMPRPV